MSKIGDERADLGAALAAKFQEWTWTLTPHRNGVPYYLATSQNLTLRLITVPGILSICVLNADGEFVISKIDAAPIRAVLDVVKIVRAIRGQNP